VALAEPLTSRPHGEGLPGGASPMVVLVLNCGSATVKFQVVETDGRAASRGGERRLARGMIDGFGPQALVILEAVGGAARRQVAAVPDHRAAVDRIAAWACSAESGIPEVSRRGGFGAVGHRVVQGGGRFTEAVLVDDEVVAAIEALGELAPLHNPAAASGMRAARGALGPAVPMVAVFDTAFFRTLPARAHTYALPHALAERHGLRRYGFHGTSHQYVAGAAARYLGRPLESLNLIVLHLGEH